MLEAVEVASETDLKKPRILRIDVQVWELSVDLLDQLDELLFRDENQRFVRVVDRPDVVTASVSVDRDYISA